MLGWYGSNTDTAGSSDKNQNTEFILITIAQIRKKTDLFHKTKRNVQKVDGLDNYSCMNVPIFAWTVER